MKPGFSTSNAYATPRKGGAISLNLKEFFRSNGKCQQTTMKVFSVVFLRLENEVGYTLGRDSR
jgi:hypothetical protein